MKTQISVRVDPATLDAIDAEARRLGVSRGHVVDKWLAESAATATRDTHRWRKVHELLEQADDYVTEVDNGYAPPTRLVAAVSCLIRAINTLNDAGTAPE